MPDLLFLVGSLRAASSSRALARTLIARLPQGTGGQIADIAVLPHYNDDLEDAPAVEAFRTTVGDADGVVFVTPEYNYSVPGVLKNAIDWASRPAFRSVFKDKLCLVITVASGATGGVRAQAHLKYILNGMLARVFVAREILVAGAPKKVEDGVFRDEETVEFAGEQLERFVATLV